LKVFDEDGNALTLNYVQQFGTRLFAWIPIKTDTPFTNPECQTQSPPRSPW
jgi:hypothetical protein